MNSPRPSLNEARDLLRLPQVRIEMSGDDRARDLYRIFTRRHARWHVIRNKVWGVALQQVPQDRATYDHHASRAMRRNVRTAAKAGLTFRSIDPLEHVAEILAIHRSTPERQGRPMHPDYLDEARVRRYLADTADVFGVFDREDILRGYLCMRDCGEVVCLERLLGHADFLDQGVMHLLFSGVMDWLIARRSIDERARWLHYDMFPGGSPGARVFKHLVGFRPYRVSWRWREP